MVLKKIHVFGDMTPCLLVTVVSDELLPPYILNLEAPGSCPLEKFCTIYQYTRRPIPKELNVNYLSFSSSRKQTQWLDSSPVIGRTGFVSRSG